MKLVDSSNITLITDLELYLKWEAHTRPLLILLALFIIMSGIWGNLFVLYGSTVSHVLKVDLISLTFIRNLALSDLCMILMVYMPLCVTILTKRWVFGPVGCFVVGNFSYTFAANELAMVMFMSVYRLWVVRKSRSERRRLPLKHVYTFMGLVFLGSLILSLAPNLLGSYVFFDPHTATCVPSIQTEKTGNIFATIYLLPPLLITLICNTSIVVLVKTRGDLLKGNSKSYRRTYLTLTLVFWAMFGAYVPVYVETFAVVAGRQVPAWFYLFRIYMMSINVIVNPVIYMITLRSFRCFVGRVMWCGWNEVGVSEGPRPSQSTCTPTYS